MKHIFLFFLCCCLSFAGSAQLQLPPSGGNQKSVVTQYVGAHAHVTITYRSPDVTSPQGQSRRGKIWGGVVPYGLQNLQFGLSTADNPSPWRAGANENTVVELSHDMVVQGKPLPAGKYGLHLIPQETGAWTVIFSHNSGAWGSYFYRESEDALRVMTEPEASPYTEWLTFEFTDRQEESCTVALKWDELSVPITFGLPDGKELYVDYLHSAMQNSIGFSWTERNNAAQYCLQNDVNLEEALAWAEQTAQNNFVGQENATTLQTLASLQMKLGKESEGMETMMQAANHASAGVFQVHQIGRQLLAAGKNDEALKVFKLNMERHGDVWPVNVGLARALSATGDLKMALKHAEKALANAPNQPNKDAIAGMIEKLKKGEGI
ncbi:DUF2911 domain-containing protein [Neolewinella persica]|uniref:DUF2911 domain-containing protein n=1 Tax=Neolewinella persica TaxID=70998 RepID=UPI00037BC5ED|nr:DUF2911 domain-containing protein [Neolewinella persica]